MADKLTKLSQAIRLGSTFRPEHRDHWFSIIQGSCAFGAAHEATFGLYATRKANYRFARLDEVGETEVIPAIPANLVKRYNVPPSLIRKLSQKHSDGGATRLEIARYLEAKGY